MLEIQQLCLEMHTVAKIGSSTKFCQTEWIFMAGQLWRIWANVKAKSSQLGGIDYFSGFSPVITMQLISSVSVLRLDDFAKIKQIISLVTL